MQILFELKDTLTKLGAASINFVDESATMPQLANSFSQIGEKSPAFKRIATLISNLLNDKENRASNFLELNNLVNAMLAIQAKTNSSPLGDSIPQLAICTTDKIYYNKMMNIKNLLEQSSNNRIDALQEYEKENFDFANYQIMHSLVCGLKSQNYSVIDFAKKHLLSFGKNALEFLKSSFNSAGRASEIRLLHLITEIGGNDVFEWIMDFINNQKNSFLKPYAIYALSNCTSAIPYLCKQEEKDKYANEKIVALTLCKDETVQKNAWLDEKDYDLKYYYDATSYIMSFYDAEIFTKQFAPIFKIFEDIFPQVKQKNVASRICTILTRYEYFHRGNSKYGKLCNKYLKKLNTFK